MNKKSVRVAALFLMLYGFYNIREFMNSEHDQTLGIISGAVLVVIGCYSLYKNSNKNS